MLFPDGMANLQALAERASGWLRGTWRALRRARRGKEASMSRAG
jgi:hypothetical protein